ncbi:hypothetical protein [Holophaga foetida]|uniref:hypothetical protein n=1 Tax=Holophaga foetida TaxID=35839 RepID=UPI000247501F|nr:hypothetical protein [Holophaga foetida]
MFQTIVDFVKAIVWPVVAIWLAYMFRSEIRTLLDRLTKIKHGDTEFNFMKEMVAVEKELDHEQESTPPAPEPAEALSAEDQLYRISSTSPRAAITEAWTMVEAALTGAANTPRGMAQLSRPRSLVGLAAMNAGLSENLSSMIQTLRELRNNVAHNPEIQVTREHAEIFIRSAIKAISLIKSKSKPT